MAQKPETIFLNGVRNKLPRELYVVKMNNPFTAGIPDLWVSGSKADLWIEGKWLPKTPAMIDLTVGKKPMLSVLQQTWLRNRHTEGRKVAVIVGSPDGGIVLKGVEWEVATAFSPILSRKEIADWITEQTM